MAKKKVKKTGGNKKAGTSKTKEEKPLYLPLVYEIPKYEDPLETTPKVTLTISLAEPQTSLFKIKDEYYITTQINTIVEKVKTLHQNAIWKVQVSKSQDSFEQTLAHEKTLEECGILG
jgi:hypothetical protein